MLCRSIWAFLFRKYAEVACDCKFGLKPTSRLTKARIASTSFLCVDTGFFLCYLQIFRNGATVKYHRGCLNSARRCSKQPSIDEIWDVESAVDELRLMRSCDRLRPSHTVSRHAIFSPNPLRLVRFQRISSSHRSS
jgi:hypothetical protein